MFRADTKDFTHILQYKSLHPSETHLISITMQTNTRFALSPRNILIFPSSKMLNQIIFFVFLKNYFILIIFIQKKP